MITEKHLYLALEVYANEPQGSPLSELALDSISEYAYAGLENPTNTEHLTEVQDIIITHALEKAVADNVLDVHLDDDGDYSFELTEEGQKLIDE